MFCWGPWTKLVLLNKKIGYPWLINPAFSHVSSLMWYSNLCYHDNNIHSYIYIYVRMFYTEMFFILNISQCRLLCAWVSTEATHLLESIQNTQKRRTNFQIRGRKKNLTQVLITDRCEWISSILWCPMWLRLQRPSLSQSPFLLHLSIAHFWNKDEDDEDAKVVAIEVHIWAAPGPVSVGLLLLQRVLLRGILMWSQYSNSVNKVLAFTSLLLWVKLNAAMRLL